MTDNIIHIDFSKPDSRWLKKAKAAREAGQVEKAAQLFRTAVEQDPWDFEAGLSYALYLWEISCWHASMRECYRLLAFYPKQEKVYGLMYRNFLLMGQEDNARFCYEKYMMHLYRNPEDGLNLNEENPPMPEKPPKRRFKRLLLRAARLMDAGDLDRANHLLVHANRSTFPRESTLRDILEVQLIAKCGMEEEAGDIVHGMLDEGRLNACEALALMPMMSQIDGPEFAGRLLLYAVSCAQNPVELHDVTAAAITMEQPKLAISMLGGILSQEEHRIDALYQLAVCHIQLGDTKTALKIIKKAYKLDPCDMDVDFLYRLLMEAVNTNKAVSDIFSMPLPLYAGPVSLGRMGHQLHLEELLSDNEPEEGCELLAQWPEQSRLMDSLCLTKPPLMDDLLAMVFEMQEDLQEAFLRRCLMCSLEEESIEEVMQMLSELGVEGEVLVLDGPYLTSRIIEPMLEEEEPDDL